MADTNDQHTLSSPEQWVDLYSDVLYGYAFTRLNDRRTAEDIVQETFLAALKARENFSGKSTERTWLVGILKNKIVDHFRKSAKETNVDDFEKFISEPESDYETGGPAIGQWRENRRPKKWLLDSSDDVEISEFWKFMQMCLSYLPSKLAEIFMLREVDDIKSEEICNDFKLSPTNLRVMMHRTRKQLRKCLEDNWIGEKVKI